MTEERAHFDHRMRKLLASADSRTQLAGYETGIRGGNRCLPGASSPEPLLAATIPLDLLESLADLARLGADTDDQALSIVREVEKEIEAVREAAGLSRLSGRRLG